MEWQQELSEKGYQKVAERLANIHSCDYFLKELTLIIKGCVPAASNLPDDIHILYNQLTSLTTFCEEYKPIIMRDLKFLFIEITNPSNKCAQMYSSTTEEGIALYHQAMQGNVAAQLKLAYFYQAIERDDWAFDWFKVVADLGSAEAQYWLGNAYFVGKVIKRNLEKAFFYYKEAAEHEHGDALNNYADMYLRGEFVEQDEGRALELFKLAAGKGVPEAMYTLGHMYENAVGTEVDMVESKRWFTESALCGDVFAANRLGHEAVEDGRGDEAIAWYQLAADQGDAYGEFNLGVCYESGIGTHVNIKKAKYWYKKAAVKGDEQAKQKLEEF
ncbi:hypothetical protein SAMN04488134_101720 [Amphibacillus marinus]|uniref:TPR repeat n=1 Tax=Amphibacillus marinus TaxID=872970 RepID=A0A1H8IUQ1_9BACI|nr:tetratricopeptide repeat protein [Amphibacillus marinus]SEN71736.1 hypothetical protein SAMN04488134_101720 [Amphibacillus marinus]